MCYLTFSFPPSGKYSTSCPQGTIYSYNMTSCNRTCQSLGQTDYSCQTTFTPVDGCGCAEGTYMNEAKECVPHEKCPCYHEDGIIEAGEAFSKDGHTWYTHCRFTFWDFIVWIALLASEISGGKLVSSACALIQYATFKLFWCLVVKAFNNKTPITQMERMCKYKDQ